MGEGLRENTGLQIIDLKSNHIGVKGCAAIAEALMHNKTLLSLDLKFNDAGDPGEHNGEARAAGIYSSTKGFQGDLGLTISISGKPGFSRPLLLASQNLSTVGSYRTEFCTGSLHRIETYHILEYSVNGFTELRGARKASGRRLRQWRR